MKGLLLDKRERTTISSEAFPVRYLQYRYPAARHAFNAFFNQPWFQRIWALQEVAWAKKVHIFWCGQYLDLSSLQPILLVFVDANAARHTMSIFDGCQKARQIGAFREKCQTNQQLLFSELMIVCVGFKAADRRDKVFALQGISNNPEIFEHPGMSPNYTRSVQEVYLLAGLHLLLREQRFGVCDPLGRRSVLGRVLIPSIVGAGHERTTGKLIPHDGTR